MTVLSDEEALALRVWRRLREPRYSIIYVYSWMVLAGFIGHFL